MEWSLYLRDGVTTVLGTLGQRPLAPLVALYFASVGSSYWCSFGYLPFMYARQLFSIWRWGTNVATALLQGRRNTGLLSLWFNQ